MKLDTFACLNSFFPVNFVSILGFYREGYSDVKCELRPEQPAYSAEGKVRDQQWNS